MFDIMRFTRKLRMRHEDIIVYDDICTFMKEEIQRSVMNRRMLSEEINKLEKQVVDYAEKYAQQAISYAYYKQMKCLHTKENKKYESKIQVLKQQIEQRDDTMAQLLNANEHLTVQLNKAREAFSEKNKNKVLTCAVCCNETIRHWKCTNSHTFCTECAYKECSRRLNNMNPSDHCFCVSDCNGIIPIDELCLKTHSSLFIKMRNEIALDRSRNFVCEFITNWSRCNTSSVIQRKVQSLLLQLSLVCADETYNAYQCPKCKYGPIFHSDCSNLHTHHLQKSESGTIDNRCPKCQHLCDDIHDMKRWNGVVQI